ncbi:Cys-tRNA(Pro) deacylase [Sporosarcina sp. CAU 1771]
MAKSSKPTKTNAMRILDREKIAYELMEYDIHDGQIDGVSVAEKTGQPQDIVYKTLVTKEGASNLFVFLIPVAQELDLKKAAKVAGVKKLDMLPVSELTKETGYMRGGCSAIGMKRSYPTFIDKSAEQFENIIVSAGKIGLQMKLAPHDLSRMTDAIFESLVKA